MHRVKLYATKLFSDWYRAVEKEFIKQLTPADTLVDLGCGDGVLTKKFSKIAGSRTVIGVDAMSSSKKVKVIRGNLNDRLPLQTGVYDAVVSHFSLEHLYNTGMFISETKRILKKGGYTLVATDNMSAWANVFSLLLGYQPFSTTNGIARRAIGNPFALRSVGNEHLDKVGDKKWREAGMYSHNKVLSYRGLIESYQEYGFSVDCVTGVGYLPFTGFLSKLFSSLDKAHTHFLILKATKQ